MNACKTSSILKSNHIANIQFKNEILIHFDISNLISTLLHHLLHFEEEKETIFCTGKCNIVYDSVIYFHMASKFQ